MAESEGVQGGEVQAGEAQSRGVLICDDDAPIRRLLRRWLEAWGYDVTDTGSAKETLGAMTDKPADILLCDISMPEHDGLWLVEQVHAQWPGTAIVMSTAYDDPQIVRKSRELGAVAFVKKPFDLNLLRHALDQAAGRSRFRPSAVRT